MKKSKFVFATIGLVIVLGLVTINTNISPKTKSIELKFSIQELITNANATCESPHNEKKYNVTKNCSASPAYITCTSGGSETCCIADHCN